MIDYEIKIRGALCEPVLLLCPESSSNLPSIITHTCIHGSFSHLIPLPTIFSWYICSVFERSHATPTHTLVCSAQCPKRILFRLMTRFCAQGPNVRSGAAPKKLGEKTYVTKQSLNDTRGSVPTKKTHLRTRKQSHGRTRDNRLPVSLRFS